jgi:peptidyl-prolyl cis-trans isomerase-like 2
MGRNKNRHSKDKLYLTVSEHQELGGKKTSEPKEKFERLPFYCCALSLVPFTVPMCTDDGTIFELVHIIPYLKKHKKNPVNGKPLSSKDLIKLNFYKNNDNEYHCPITFKVFTENSYIVAVKVSGNVYSAEAIEELCKKPNNWKDLLTNEPFSSKDLIVIQDPNRPKDSSKFHFIQKAEKKLKKIKEVEETKEPKHDRYTTGMTAASFTSTSLAPQTENAHRSLSDTEIRKLCYQEIQQSKELGLVTLHTTQGPLSFKLFCYLTLMTCENFLTLCEEGYYDNTPFHRSIPGFIIQGGDPSGTGTGGKNIFGIPHFRDEFNETLRHVKRGMISMANSGPNTNRSQFFITYKAAPHLDNKHSVFGEVTGDSSTLDILEDLPTNSSNKFHKVEVKILTTEVHYNPYNQAKQKVMTRLTHSQQKKEADWLEIPEAINLPEVVSTGIGKYLSKKKSTELPSGIYAEYDSKKSHRQEFDFNNW